MQEMMRWVNYSKSIGWNFNGRARRSEYWWNHLYYMLVSIGLLFAVNIITVFLGMITGMAAGFSEELAVVIVSIISLLKMGATLAVYIWEFYWTFPILVRRMHDRGMSGWLYLVFMLLSCFCCIGFLILLVILCMDSQAGDNQYGPNPKSNEQSLVQ